MRPVDEAVRGRREAGLGLYDETRRLRRRERRGEEDSGKDQARADDGQSTAIKTYLRGLYRYTRNPMYVGVLTNGTSMRCSEMSTTRTVIGSVAGSRALGGRLLPDDLGEAPAQAVKG
jgi:hypothetical protein